MSATTPPAATNQPVPEPGIEPEGIDTPVLVIWGFVSVVITICLMLVAAALFFSVQNSIDEVRLVAPKYEEAEKVLSDQQGVLASFGAPTAEGDPYKISIDDAKALVVAEANSQQNEN